MRFFRKVASAVLFVVLLLSLSSCDLLTSKIKEETDPLNDKINQLNEDLPYKLPPVISTNTIGVKITDIGYNLRGVDNFPSVTVRAKITDSAGNVIADLQEPDFFDAIDDNGKPRPIYVTAPVTSTTSGKFQADIVFVIDTTGSMGSYLTTMTDKAQDFADKLAASDVDYRLGYVTFGDDIRKATHERLAPTSNITTFKTEIALLSAYGGDDLPENQIDALDYARASASEASISNPWGSFQDDMSFTYRASAKKVFILITDIGYHTPDDEGDVYYYYSKHVANTPEDEVAKLKADGVTCFIVGPSDVTPTSYESIASATGGAFYPSGSDFADILDTLGGEISSLADYIITFMTDDFTASKLHTVRLAVHTALGEGQDTATFTSPATVNYTRAMNMLNQQKALMIRQKALKINR